MRAIFLLIFKFNFVCFFLSLEYQPKRIKRNSKMNIMNIPPKRRTRIKERNPKQPDSTGFCGKSEPQQRHLIC